MHRNMPSKFQTSFTGRRGCKTPKFGLDFRPYFDILKRLGVDHERDRQTDRHTYSNSAIYMAFDCPRFGTKRVLNCI